MCPVCCWATHPRRRRHWPMARSTKRCGTLPCSATMVFLANWLSWIVNIDRPSVEGHSEQHNQLNLSLGCLGDTCQARSTLITQPVSGVAGLSASSDISQGSVTTRLRCGGICSDSFITNCFLILIVKEFWKSVNIWWSYEVYKKLCHFLAHPVYVKYKIIKKNLLTTAGSRLAVRLHPGRAPGSCVAGFSLRAPKGIDRLAPQPQQIGNQISANFVLVCMQQRRNYHQHYTTNFGVDYCYINFSNMPALTLTLSLTPILILNPKLYTIILRLILVIPRIMQLHRATLMLPPIECDWV